MAVMGQILEDACVLEASSLMVNETVEMMHGRSLLLWRALPCATNCRQHFAARAGAFDSIEALKALTSFGFRLDVGQMLRRRLVD